MSIWNRFFGKASGKGVDDSELFRYILYQKLQEVRNLGEPYKSLVEQYFNEDALSILVDRASEKMRQTQSDGLEHSFALAMPYSPVFCQVCTLAIPRQQAKDWFIRKYGGYSKLLESSWNSDQFRISECTVFCHIVYGRVKSDWFIYLSIFPLGDFAFSFHPISSKDLFTEIELSRLLKRTYGKLND